METESNNVKRKANASDKKAKRTKKGKPFIILFINCLVKLYLFQDLKTVFVALFSYILSIAAITVCCIFESFQRNS